MRFLGGAERSRGGLAGSSQGGQKGEAMIWLRGLRLWEWWGLSSMWSERAKMSMFTVSPMRTGRMLGLPLWTMTSMTSSS